MMTIKPDTTYSKKEEILQRCERSQYRIMEIVLVQKSTRRLQEEIQKLKRRIRIYNLFFSLVLMMAYATRD